MFLISNPMNIYEIHKKMKAMKIPVFKTNEIARISNLKKPCAIVYIKRMIDKKLLYRISKGIYSLEDDPILYASYITPNSYISFNAALYLHKAINQIPTEIHVVVPKRIKKNVDGITFVHFPKRMVFGFKKIEYKGYMIWIAEIEKAILDISYKYGNLPQNIEKINRKKIVKYAKKMKISNLEVFT